MADRDSHARGSTAIALLVVVFVVFAGCLQGVPGGGAETTSLGDNTSGCGFTDSGPDPCPLNEYPPDLHVLNENITENAAVNITITNDAGEVVYEKKVSVSSDQTRIRLREVVTAPGNYTIHARMGNTSATRVWDVGETVPLDGAIYQVVVYPTDLKIEKVPYG